MMMTMNVMMIEIMMMTIVMMVVMIAMTKRTTVLWISSWVSTDRKFSRNRFHNRIFVIEFRNDSIIRTIFAA